MCFMNNFVEKEIKSMKQYIDRISVSVYVSGIKFCGNYCMYRYVRVYDIITFHKLKLCCTSSLISLTEGEITC